MTIAEVPGNTNQMMGIAPLDLDQRLGSRDYFDQPAVLQHQRIATAQRYRIFEIEQELESARPSHGHASPVTIVEIEHDRIGRRLCPAMLPLDLRGTDHGRHVR